MIQDDDNKVLSRWAQQYDEVKRGGAARIMWQIINRDVIKYNSVLKEMYFYYITKDEKLREQFLTFANCFTITFPPEYVEKLQFMGKDSIDTDVINELVDICINKLIKMLETNPDYDFYDIIPEKDAVV